MVTLFWDGDDFESVDNMSVRRMGDRYLRDGADGECIGCSRVKDGTGRRDRRGGGGRESGRGGVVWMYLLA